MFGPKGDFESANREEYQIVALLEEDSVKTEQLDGEINTDRQGFKVLGSHNLDWPTTFHF